MEALAPEEVVDGFSNTEEALDNMLDAAIAADEDAELSLAVAATCETDEEREEAITDR